jgi:hypothetical protein
MNPVEQIITVLTREAIIARLGVTTSSITDAVSGGVMPARWYRVIRTMLEEAGLPEPALDLFAMRPDRSAPQQVAA